MTSPDPVLPVDPFCTEIVTTDGRACSATSVAEQAVSATAVGLAEVRLAATMAPPITPPTTSATTKLTQKYHRGRPPPPATRAPSCAPGPSFAMSIPRILETVRAPD